MAVAALTAIVVAPTPPFAPTTATTCPSPCVDHRLDQTSQAAHCPVQCRGSQRLRQAIPDAGLDEFENDGVVERVDQQQHRDVWPVAQEALRPAHQVRLLPSIQDHDDGHVGGSYQRPRVVFADAAGRQPGLLEERRQSLVARNVYELGHCVPIHTGRPGRTQRGPRPVSS